MGYLNATLTPLRLLFRRVFEAELLDSLDKKAARLQATEFAANARFRRIQKQISDLRQSAAEAADEATRAYDARRALIKAGPARQA